MTPRAAARWALALALALPLPAQDRPSFDPSRDLEGFDAAYASEFREFYGLDEYAALLGKDLPPAELAAVRERWKATCASADAKVRELRADPAEESAWLLQRRLARSSYFSKITLLEDRSVPGLEFLVQRPPKDDPAYAAKLAARHGPWIAKIAEVFDAGYAKPLGLARPTTHSLWSIGILASRGDYHNYWRVHPNPCANEWAACYDTKLGLVVGYEDPFQVGAVAAEARYPLLHAAVREMIFAYTTSRDRRPWAMWVEEGLASYLAYHEGLTPDCLSERRIRPATLKAIVAYAEDPKLRDAVLHPIAELADLREPEELDRLVEQRCEQAGVVMPSEADVIGGFYGEAALWIHFLHRGRDGKLREPFLQYLKWALSANGGSDALRVALSEPDLAALDREFFRWVFQEHQRAFPAAKLDPSAIDALFLRRAVAVARATDAPNAAAPPTSSAPAGASAAGAGAAPAPFSPAVLAIDPSESEARHGLALLQARAGDLEGALAALAAIADSKPAPPEDERVRRDVERVRQLALLRAGFLQSLVASGAKWTVEYEGKKVVASVRKVEGGAVHLAENRQGVQSIPLAALDVVEIARQAGKREQQGNSEPWARFYAYVLGGDAKWEKLLKADSEGARNLREDAATWLPKTIRTGRAAARVEELARGGIPGTAAAGRAVAETIRTLIADSPDLPVVLSRAGDLRRLAAAALEVSLAEESPAALLHGKWKDLGDGRVSLAWEFESEAEAGDFRKQVGYLSEWRKALKIDAGKEAESSWTVRDGSFQGIGAACYRLPLEFSAPMTIRYELRVLDADDSDKLQANFTVGLCDDGKRNQILALNFGDLFVRNAGKQSGREEKGGESFSYFLSTDYAFEVRHDGEKVTVTVDGEKRSETACLGRKSGGVILWFHTTLPVAIGRFEVEGRIEPGSAAELRRARVEEKLVELGFPR